jgi:RNA polymerase sigma factor (TIGR02999 family)
MPSAEPITLLLDRMRDGDSSAFESLVAAVYPELKRMATTYLRGERRDHTLQPTELVHEAYLRLAHNENASFQSRAHFYAAASTIMRRILVDYARRHRAAKRGNELKTPEDPAVLGETVAAPGTAGFGLVCEVDDAINTLAKSDPLKARLIEMRFFGGLTAEESAAVMNMSVHAVRGQLRVAQAMLQRELDRGAGAE